MWTTRDVLLYLLVFFVDMFFFLFSFRIDMVVCVCVCLTISDCTCVVLFYPLLSAVEWRKRGSCHVSFNPRIDFLSHASLFLLFFPFFSCCIDSYFIEECGFRGHTPRFVSNSVSFASSFVGGEECQFGDKQYTTSLACSDLSNSNDAHRGSTSSRCGGSNCCYWIVCGFWSELGCGRHGSRRTPGFEITDWWWFWYWK